MIIGEIGLSNYLRNNNFAYFIKRLLSNKKTKLRSLLSQQRRMLSLFDYKNIACNIPVGLDHPLLDNSFYGLKEILGKYADVRITNNTLIEHGLYFGGYVSELLLEKPIDKIITFSEYRKSEILKKHPQKNVVPIGPYIHYAESLLSYSELAKIKASLGKTLLVFPSHSIEGMRKNFKQEDFIKEINHIKEDNDFQTVLVCLYWKDIQAREELAYLNQGFRVVTAGHRNDSSFLSRLKSIIDLADITMSNDLGTHIGFCILMNKPHYIFHQQVSAQSHGVENQHIFIREQKLRNVNQLEQIYQEKKIFYASFGVYQEFINEEQLKLVNHYWGIGAIKKPAELSSLIK